MLTYSLLTLKARLSWKAFEPIRIRFGELDRSTIVSVDKPAKALLATASMKLWLRSSSSSWRSCSRAAAGSVSRAFFPSLNTRTRLKPRNARSLTL